MQIETVAVVGAGTMGNGIAHVFALHGRRVVLVDVEQERLDLIQRSLLACHPISGFRKEL